MKRVFMILMAFGLVSTGAFAVDLSVDAVFDITGKAPAKGYLTVKGAAASVEKDTVDATTGASKLKGTAVWNTYRLGADKKSTTIAGGIQSLVKYPVSPLKQYEADGLNVIKAADGTMTIQYIHRGTAYKMVTDKNGKLVLPKGDYKKRTVAILQADGTNFVSKDFSTDNTVAKVDWKKVWDTNVAVSVIGKVKTADGKETEVKTGSIVDDFPTAADCYEGVLQVTLVGTLMTVKGDLNIKK